jgi:hypothetical protein
VVDVRQLVRSTEFAPRHRDVTVEDQCRVSLAFANQALLVGTIALVAYAPLGTRRMEPGAPATVPDAVVLLRKVYERIPRRGVELPDRVILMAEPV